MRILNVLSVFDGMSCGQIALERTGIKVENYFASEIDKYAIRVAQENYPNTIQLGDINNWKEWNLPKIDLLIGGSPCQGFSQAGLRMNFDDPQSKLFFVFVDILKYYKSKNKDLKYLLENVKMKKVWANIISDILETEPILINSALCSAQRRERLYWTNIKNIDYPENKNILVKDILEKDIPEKYYLNESWQKWWGKNEDFQIKKRYSSYVNLQEKSLPLTARQYANWNENFVLEQIGSMYKNNGDAGRIYSVFGKARTLKGESGGMGGKMGLYTDGKRIRKLTPVECERLQTVPDNYTDGVSDTQRYKMLGNGWTVDVIAHIFNFIPEFE